MSSAILVHPEFDRGWPFTANAMRDLWEPLGPVEFIRCDPSDRRPAHELLTSPETITRLCLFRVPVTPDSLKAMPVLKELAASLKKDDPIRNCLADRGVRLIWQTSEGYWGQSVSEFGLALTLCALRRIPQTHHRILTDLADWDYQPPGGIGKPGQRGIQFGDDSRFTNGTLAGNGVRIVGAGNIGSRYASFCSMLGADVAVWDPYASEPAFHRAGARREHHLDRLVRDAEIFVPMVPLTKATEGLVTADHINALPTGCLVVTVTRARIVDCETLYRRVCNNELALAADVFDDEPVPLGHRLLGRDNVVHTPHNAGRTIDANKAFAKALHDQFQI